MKDLRLTRLILALSKTDIQLLKKQLKINNNKIYLVLFTAFEQLKITELSRDEIYLRVYKKKWNTKLDAAFRTDLSRLADFIEDILIQQRLIQRIKNDNRFYEEEKLLLYNELLLDKESKQQYQLIIDNESIQTEIKNLITINYSDLVINSSLSLKEKIVLIDELQLELKKQSNIISEIQQSKVWLLKCLFNYYYRQINGKYFENINTEELLSIANKLEHPEAKFNILNGISYLKIDSKITDIDIAVYENAVDLATILTQKNPAFIHKQLKALHLIGTRYSILGNFEKGNFYFENAINILPNVQYKNYKTIILNYATNCSKLKQFDKSLQLIQMLEEVALHDSKLNIECSIRSLSCYLFMEDAKVIHQLVVSQDYSIMQPHEKIYFRLCQCLAFVIDKEFELAHTEINNLLRSKLMQEIDADFLPATQLISFIIAAIFKNGKLKFTTNQQSQFNALKDSIKLAQYPYLQHYSPYLWLIQKMKTF